MSERQRLVSENYRFRAEAAEALAARYEQALRELLDSVGVVLDDDRLGYIEVQLDPDALATARAALAAGGTQPG